MEPPVHWLRTIENIRRVRQKFPAPVDSMGCAQAPEEYDKDANQRYQVLTSLMLSSQTKDPITWAAVQKLKEKGICNPEGILKTSEHDIEDLIKPVGFFRRKAVYLKKVAQILIDKYEGDIPRTIKELCELPGVGPKMAHLCMSEAWNHVTGIGVDVHVHRISARLGWVPKTGIKTPEDTRKALETWLPRTYWREINKLLVGFGQTICTPLRPKCDECYNNLICPSAKLGKEAKAVAKEVKLKNGQKELLASEKESPNDAGILTKGRTMKSVTATKIKSVKVNDLEPNKKIKKEDTFKVPDVPKLKNDINSDAAHGSQEPNLLRRSLRPRIKIEPN